MNSSDWLPPKFFSENLDKVGIGVLKDMFSQAEKRLIQTIDTANTVTSKAYKILPITLSLLVLSTGYIFSKEGRDMTLFLTASYSMIFSSISLIYLVHAIWSYEFHVVGSSPKMTFDEVFVKDLEELDQQKYFLMNEAKEYQSRIEFNQEINSKRQKNVKWAIILLSVIPVSFLLARITSLLFKDFLIPYFDL